ncbi:hypothetical protein GCM10027185_21260 [Spirosoma pulveris]
MGFIVYIECINPQGGCAVEQIVSLVSERQVTRAEGLPVRYGGKWVRSDPMEAESQRVVVQQQTPLQPAGCS